MSVTSMKQGWKDFRAERSVKRPRKPEDVAQPGEANPVWVAARDLIR
jgi:hypothetical protein